MRLGYCCINQTLSNENPKIYTGRKIQKAKFDKYGLDLCSELALQNCKDLFKILYWNEKSNIRLFRIGSNIFPWGTFYNLENLKDFDKICKILKVCGEYARDNGHRLTFHPDHFVKLASVEPMILSNSIKELELHSLIFDLMEFEPSFENIINIHVGAVYDGNKEKTIEQFCNNFYKLSENTRKRISVENDDKPQLFNTTELLNGICFKIGIPLVFDLHHNTLCGKEDVENCLKDSSKTWGSITPLIHYSESRSREYDDATIKPQAHSDYYKEFPEILNNFNLDIDLECKMKELALIDLRTKFGLEF